MQYILILVGVCLIMKVVIGIMASPWFWLFLVGAMLTGSTCCCCKR